MSQNHYRHPQVRARGAGHRRLNRRRRLGPHVPRSAYRELILRQLLDSPQHTLPSREVRRRIAEQLRNRFTPIDLAPRSSGATSPLWANEMQWVKKQLLVDGLMESVLSAGHGIWKLTTKGVREAGGISV